MAINRRPIRKKLTIKYLPIIVLTISLSLNVFCVLPYVGSYIYRIKEYFVPTKYFAKNVPDSIVISRVLEASITMDGIEFSCEQPKRGLVYDIHEFISPSKSTNLFNNYSKAFLYAGLSEYAVSYKDTAIISYLQSKLDSYVKDNKLVYHLQEVDQVPIGIAYLNLYKLTSEDKYLLVSNHIYKWLLTKKEKESNIIYYRFGSSNQFVDGLGMFVPFLVEYSKVTNDSTAYVIAKDNMVEYYKYGVDKETGIPSHGYNKYTHLKVGSANWGRGIGWYVLALAYMPEIDSSKLDNVLPTLSATQFPETSSAFDSSTALMFQLYLQSKGSRPYSIDFIKPYITQDGKVMRCSGDTYDFNNHSHIFGPAELANGLFLMLVSHNNYSNYAHRNHNTSAQL